MAETAPPVDPQQAAELLAYQEGAIVSRALLKAAGGVVTLFAFDVGQSLGEHTVPHDALILAIEGAADITVGGNVRRLQAGEILQLPGNVSHDVVATQQLKMLLVLLR